LSINYLGFTKHTHRRSVCLDMIQLLLDFRQIGYQVRLALTSIVTSPIELGFKAFVIV